MRTDRLLLEDMLAAIDEVIETTPAAKCDFDANKLVRSHVLRHIQIIGEVAWRISEESKARYPKYLGSRWPGCGTCWFMLTSRSTGTASI